MSASKHQRSGSDSWSAMPPTTHAEGGLTEATAQDDQTRNTHTSPSQLHGEAAEVLYEHSGAVSEVSSPASEDSWVELTEAELQSPSNNPLLPTSTEEPTTTGSGVEIACDKDEEESQHTLADEESTNALSALRPATAAADGIPPQEESAAMLPNVEEASMPADKKIDLSEFLAGLTLTKAYEATAENKPVTEREAAARALASLCPAEPTDGFTSVMDRDEEESQEMNETIDLEFVLSSRSARQENTNGNNANNKTSGMPVPASSTSHIPRSLVMPPSTGATQVLRRRMVAMDWMRTLRGPSDLSPEERVEVFQALFGEPADAPITAERFKEMMVPFERHCDCLGASYGFHHQGCQFRSGTELAS